MSQVESPSTDDPRIQILYHLCRLQLPAVTLTELTFRTHIQRAYSIYRAKHPEVDWSTFLDNLYAVDFYLAAACLERNPDAWDTLFAARSGRADCLLVDVLRARAVRLYPGDSERQEAAVMEFWSNLIVPDREGGIAILARYDGQRPLVPWLLRVFQNWHISQLRKRSHEQSLPDEDILLPIPAAAEGRWHEAFCLAARAYLHELPDHELLILGLRFRYRLSQRELADLLGLHEGTLSRQTTKLSKSFAEAMTQSLTEQGWTGDDLSTFVQREMESLLLDEPRLSADNLRRLLAARGKKLPRPPSRS